MRSLLLLLLLVPIAGSAQLSKQDSLWLPFKDFIGEWKGTGDGVDGSGTYQRSYTHILNKNYIEVRNKTVYAPNEKSKKGYIHEDIGYISYDKMRKTFVFRQFHAEGFINQYKLVNGSEIRYGYGFRFGFIQESPSIWHGGLINGFMSMAMYLPKEDVFVTVLSNCNNVSPERVTAKLAAIAIGKPYSYKEITVSTSALQIYSGLYHNEAGDKMVISTADDRLFLQRGNGPKVSVKAFAKDGFFIDDGMISIKFTTDKSGKVNKLLVNTRNGGEVWIKTE